MVRLAPSVQTEAESLQNAGEAAQTEVAAPEPLVSGAAPVLWAGFGAFVLIFIVGMMLIIRGRVTHAKPKKSKHVETTYFEPAGEDAEITFDDEEPAPTAKKTDHWRDAQVGETEVIIEHGEPQEEAELTTPVAKREKKKSPFAGLFSKKPAREPDPADDNESLTFDDEGDGPAFDEDPPAEAAFDDDRDEEPVWREPVREAPRQPPPAPPRLSSDSAADKLRVAQAEETAQAALQRAEEAEALARDLKRANEEAQNVMTLGLRKQEAALSEGAEALNAMEKRLTGLSEEFHRRLDAAATPVQALAAPSESAAHGAGVSEDHFAEFADLMGEQFDALRNTVNGAIERLSKRLDHLPAAPAGAGTATAARIQLSDLLGDALAPQRFKLGHKLSTGRTADAVIIMPGPMAPIAVDARFPAEIFDDWQMSRNAGTETELRRAVLRNIASAGEKLIAPDETADCALMFIPSEHILSELHASFSDLVQESYRARVWMVSPTSLMATLHTISAVMAGAGIREASAVNVIDELHQLRGRVAALEARRANGAHPAPAAPEKPAQAAAPVEEAKPASQPVSQPSAPDEKSPFPLR